MEVDSLSLLGYKKGSVLINRKTGFFEPAKITQEPFFT